MPAIEVEKGITDECHPEIFDVRAMPAPTKEKKPGQLADHLIRDYFEKVSGSFALLQSFF